jgi:hypothetical protein
MVEPYPDSMALLVALTEVNTGKGSVPGITGTGELSTGRGSSAPDSTPVRNSLRFETHGLIRGHGQTSRALAKPTRPRAEDGTPAQTVFTGDATVVTRPPHGSTAMRLGYGA